MRMNQRLAFHQREATSSWAPHASSCATKALRSIEWQVPLDGLLALCLFRKAGCQAEKCADLRKCCSWAAPAGRFVPPIRRDELEWETSWDSREDPFSWWSQWTIAPIDTHTHTSGPTLFLKPCTRRLSHGAKHTSTHRCFVLCFARRLEEAVVQIGEMYFVNGTSS